MSKKMITVIIPMVLFMVLLFIFGVNIYNNKLKTFQADGHIITSKNKVASKLYFSKGESYKLTANNVIFKDQTGKKKKVSTNNFMHYTDGSISSFKKTAILNLNDINDDNKSYKFYNTYAGSILTKKNKIYQISYLDKTLNFDNFLIKVSDKKYMVVASKIEVNLGTDKRTVNDGYVEVNYLDGKIIKVENQEFSLQTINEDSYLKVNGTYIDLFNKEIYTSESNKLKLKEIDIDGKDNEQIKQEEKNVVINNTTNNTTINNGGNTGGTRKDLPDINTEITNTAEMIDIINKNKDLKEPEIAVSSFNVTSVSLQTEMTVIDEEKNMTGDINVKIIKNSTNEVVYENSFAEGTKVIDVENTTLSPEETYLLIVNSNYTKGDISYNKDFVQKTFITEPIGVEIEKNYVGTNEISVLLSKKAYSLVNAVTCKLLDKNGQVLKTMDVTLSSEDKEEIVYEDLNSNSEYKVLLTDFVYRDVIVSASFDEVKTIKTLKEKPTFGDVTFRIDKKNNEFELLLENVVDKQNGIESLKYEVYDARTLGEEDSVFVTTKKINETVSVKVDGKKVKRTVPYVYRVIATFNDNEKERVYTSSYSDVMIMDGVEFPTVTFKKEEVTFEKIEGTFTINDPGNAIDIDNDEITITYTDSVGQVNSYTSVGSTKIPLSINGLRANESYTFEISTRVDLKDGNDPIDNLKIATIIVKTESPNPFKLNYEVETDNVDDAFKVNAKLAPYDKDTTLEANTLSGLTINVYQGLSTTGKLVTSVTKTDLDTAPYVSTLKPTYYDNEFTITPEMFGLKNEAFTSEYYTIQVTDAYDYTTHKNDLPIKNNVIYVRTNDYVPELPEDPNNAVTCVTIKNKESGSKHRDDLDGETIVGYVIKAVYDNSQKYAKKIIYKLHDADSGKVIDTYEYVVPESGNIDNVYYYLKDGVNINDKDDEFRRGGKYYFTYTAVLDIKGNEITYPTTDVTLRSKELAPEKQPQSLLLYPVTRENNDYYWKYSYQDIDNASVDDKLYYKLDDTALGNVKMQKTESGEYKTAKFTLTKDGQFEIYTKECLINTEEDITATTQVSNYFESMYEPSNIGTYDLTVDINRATLSLLYYDLNPTFYKRVAGADIKYESGDKEKTIKGYDVVDGEITIDLSELEEFMGLDVKPTVTLYYDDGTYGFETPGEYFTLQKLKTDKDPVEEYLSITSSSSMSASAYAGKAFYTKTFNHPNLFIQNISQSKSATLALKQTNSGLKYNESSVSPKKLSAVQINKDGEQTFKFDSIVPGVSVQDESGNYRITPGIDNVSINATLYGAGSRIMKDGKAYIEIYNANTGQKIKTEEYDAEDFEETIKINGLNAYTNYYFIVCANILSSGKYVYTQLYDVNDNSTDKKYTFTTLDNIGITDANVSYDALTYGSRKLVLSYKIKELSGYDKIDYEIYKVTTNGLSKINIDIPTDTIFNKEMEKQISIPVDCGIEAGYEYKIKILPSATVEGQKVNLVSKEISYDFAALYVPYISVTSSLTEEGEFAFKINVKDYQKSMVNGEYEVKVFNEDGDNITAEEYKNKKFSIDDINNMIVVENANVDEKYTLRVLYSQDVYNVSSKIVSKEKSYTGSITNTEGINIGNVYADTNLEDKTKINLSFFESYRLTDIETLRYSIYDTEGNAVDGNMIFEPTLVQASTDSYYRITLPNKINKTGIYYIVMQFIYQGKIVGEESIEYRYV